MINRDYTQKKGADYRLLLILLFYYYQQAVGSAPVPALIPVLVNVIAVQAVSFAWGSPDTGEAVRVKDVEARSVPVASIE